jgi:thiamine biosynthesis lipoprotein
VTVQAVLALALSMGLFAAQAASPVAPDTVVRNAHAMGTDVTVIVTSIGRREALRGAEAALAEIEAVEARLSTWRPDSELSRLNRLPVGGAWEGDLRVLDLLAEVLEWRDRTGGAFDPAVGSLIDIWDLRGNGRIPSDAEISKALGSTGERGLASGQVPFRRTADAWVDAGGFGKGAALRDVARVLDQTGAREATVNLGGQLLVLGHSAEVSLAHPEDRHRPTLELALRAPAGTHTLSVATSGLSERFVKAEGRRVGHVIDPRSGRPVPAWGSVTVVSGDPLEADVLSTALLVMGPEEGLRFADQLPEVGAVFLILSDGVATPAFSRGMERFSASTLSQPAIQRADP